MKKDGWHNLLLTGTAFCSMTVSCLADQIPIATNGMQTNDWSIIVDNTGPSPDYQLTNGQLIINHLDTPSGFSKLEAIRTFYGLSDFDLALDLSWNQPADSIYEHNGMTLIDTNGKVITNIFMRDSWNNTPGAADITINGVRQHSQLFNLEKLALSGSAHIVIQRGVNGVPANEIRVQWVSQTVNTTHQIAADQEIAEIRLWSFDETNDNPNVFSNFVLNATENRPETILADQALCNLTVESTDRHGVYGGNSGVVASGSPGLTEQHNCNSITVDAIPKLNINNNVVLFATDLAHQGNPVAAQDFKASVDIEWNGASNNNMNNLGIRLLANGNQIATSIINDPWVAERGEFDLVAGSSRLETGRWTLPHSGYAHLEIVRINGQLTVSAQQTDANGLPLVGAPLYSRTDTNFEPVDYFSIALANFSYGSSTMAQLIARNPLFVAYGEITPLVQSLNNQLDDNNIWSVTEKRFSSIDYLIQQNNLIISSMTPEPGEKGLLRVSRTVSNLGNFKLDADISWQQDRIESAQFVGVKIVDTNNQIIAVAAFKDHDALNKGKRISKIRDTNDVWQTMNTSKNSLELLETQHLTIKRQSGLLSISWDNNQALEVANNALIGEIRLVAFGYDHTGRLNFFWGASAIENLQLEGTELN